jgi:hypothetical protein
MGATELPAPEKSDRAIAAEIGAAPEGGVLTMIFKGEPIMPRPRQRVCLQDGLRLDLNRLIRRGSVRPGARRGPHLIQWTNNYTGEVVASGEITANLCGQEEGWFRFEADGIDQRITLVPRPRHFGGAQWYFICPATNRRASVLWMPPGAERFCSRQTWGRRVVAYRSQFLGADDRAHAGKAKVKSRLIGNRDPNEWDLPPKPKWMRWRTYNRYVERYDAYEDILDQGIGPLIAKLIG